VVKERAAINNLVRRVTVDEKKRFYVVERCFVVINDITRVRNGWEKQEN
jgi:hypothetical protein